ncbi:hypothetical protein BDW74DRAFT_153984 [Aspergillus multicolor]|uniref:uncharacterized protein n=1 Tax=Aspergillus multicolor TaxID=41759 RepID=UPI003CCCAE6B
MKPILIWTILAVLQSPLVQGAQKTIVVEDDSEDVSSSPTVPPVAAFAAGGPPNDTCSNCHTQPPICDKCTTYIVSGSMVRPAVTIPQQDTIIECHGGSSSTTTQTCTPPPP